MLGLKLIHVSKMGTLPEELFLQLRAVDAMHWNVFRFEMNINMEWNAMILIKREHGG